MASKRRHEERQETTTAMEAPSSKRRRMSAERLDGIDTDTDDQMSSAVSTGEELEEEERELLQAIVEDDVAAVRALLATGQVDVNCGDVDEDGEIPLHVASKFGHKQIVELLLNAGANVHATDMSDDRETPLHVASYNGHVHVVELLLNAGASVHATTENGLTPLHIASFAGHARVVEVLLNAGANVYAMGEDGATPLHWAADNRDTKVSESLLKAHANIDASAHNGATPFLNACYRHRTRVVRFLQRSGANVRARDNEGSGPLQQCIRGGVFAREVTTDTMETLQVLVSIGVTWDTKCDEMVASGKASDEAPAIRLCVLLWTDERNAGRSLTTIPVEVVRRGASDTQAFIDALKTSTKTMFRRRLCILGPTCWGKTSFIKSLLQGEPSLDHRDDRTIGIDIFAIEFKDGSDTYVITIWDYAGQEEYQPAHAVFFSQRTVYVVVVDLHSSSLAKAQSEFRADDDMDYENRMDEYVSRKILRWIRLVFARQPDAEFVLVGTKADLIHHSVARIAELKEDLSTRLVSYAVAYQAEVKREIEAVRTRISGSTSITERLDRLQRLRDSAMNMAPSMWLTVSCKEKHWVEAARNDLQLLLEVTKHRSFEMPESYTSVQNLIQQKKDASADKRSRQRVLNTFVPYNELEAHLKERMPDLTNCREILRTLHDLGDVLWYDNLDTDQFKNTVIIDPLLLIDFNRQIFNHNYKGETMPHSTLVSRPFWVDVATDLNLVLSLKQVLHHFHLVYPSRGEMAWDSEIMVPAKWRTNWESFRRVAGLPLRLEQGDVCKHVRWDYHFSSELPDAVYDHFVVATYSSVEDRVVGPYGVLWGPTKNNMFACRAVMERKGRFTLVRVEAIAGDGAKWHPFERLVRGMETVLIEFPGLLVTRSAVDSNGTIKKLEVVMDDARESDLRELAWLPPDITWYCDLKKR